MAKILNAAAKADARVHAFILVMRHVGLRISDTTALAVSAVQDNKIRLHQAKTGEYVFVPIPYEVVKALRALPQFKMKYTFWRRGWESNSGLCKIAPL